MNRYKVTFSDDTIMRLYANTKDDLPIPVLMINQLFQ